MFQLLPEYIGHAWPTFMWTVTIVAAIGCIMGFYEFVWFMSVGYGFAVMCIGLFHLIFGLAAGTATIATTVMSVLFVIYGWRLGGYILKRELTNANYKKKVGDDAFKRTPIFVSLFMWIIMMFLYTAQTSPLSYRVINRSADDVTVWVGIAIMALAIIGEATADHQKSAAKKENPHRFCDTGLFKFVRCPNYFSEILFWIGVFVSGIGTMQGAQWVIAGAALIVIIYVMYDSAKRLELRHEKTYGLDPEYQKYSDTVPILFPFTKHCHIIKTYRD